MKSSNTSALLSFVFLLPFSALWATSTNTQEDFLQCLYSQDSTLISQVTYTPDNSSYLPILNFTIQNLRFTRPDTPKPQVIVTPVDESQIRAVIFCSKENRLNVRVRSGGHDFEGLSYVSHLPFVMIDLINLRSITVDIGAGTAWVQPGADLGELYYSIGKASRTLGFPAGVCTTVGAGGHLSGAGYGILIRKFGVAADHIIDARLMDVNGKILDKKSMGKDLFWAIRGGGGSSFGVIVAYKLNLVHVPEIMTGFAVNRTLEQNLTMLIHRWQHVAPFVHKDLTLRIDMRPINSSQDGKKTLQATFLGTFPGGVDRLLQLVQESFPQLGLVREDCTEMSWIQSVVYIAGLSGIFPSNSPPEVLLNRTIWPKAYFKAKSDYVMEPIPENALEGMWEFFLDDEAELAMMDWTPYGGIMEEIPESKIAFPHRAGNLYFIFYYVAWDGSQGTNISQGYIDWIRRLYNYMTPYVSKCPRAAFFPYRDLDLGVNNIGNTSYKQASIWGMKYFKNNFNRLVRVKTRVDPANFFHDEQSIPSLAAMVEETK